MLKASASHILAKRASTDLKYGYYVPKIEREVRVNNVRETHFTLGNEKEIYKTTNKEF
jgi:hypothetical protein